MKERRRVCGIILTGIFLLIFFADLAEPVFASGASLTLNTVIPKSYKARLTRKTSQSIPASGALEPINFIKTVDPSDIDDVDYDPSGMYYSDTTNNVYGIRIPANGMYLITASWRCPGFPKHSVTAVRQPFIQLVVYKTTAGVASEILHAENFIFYVNDNAGQQAPPDSTKWATGYVGQSAGIQLSAGDIITMSVAQNTGSSQNTLTNTNGTGVKLADPPTLTLTMVQ